MSITGLIFLLVTHFLTGRGIISLFRIKGRLYTIIPLSFIIGVVVCSQVPMLLEMCRIPITATTVATAISGIALLIFGMVARKLDYTIFSKRPHFNIRIYEVFYICVFIFLMLPSIWRCFYYPPNARDVLAGPEPIAEFAVKEHTMVNSALTVDLAGTNNHLKPPFISGLQIVYKLLVHPFGQLWLTVLVLSFMIWLYCLMRERVRPFIAGFLMLFFICMPDPYGYTYLILFDYSNMILFFAGGYYVCMYALKGERNLLFFASFLLGLATAIRAETLVLCAMFIPAIAFTLYKRPGSMVRKGLDVVLFMAIPFVFYYIWIGIFLKYYMPGGFDLGEQVTHSWGNVGIIFERMSQMNSALFFGSISALLYGYIHYLFLLVLAVDCVFIRRFSKEALWMLYGVALVYVGMALMGYITPLFDLGNTTKRGVYKMFPFMMLYMANSGILQKLSGLINSFEYPEPKAQAVQPKAVTSKTVKKKKK